jgi:hypothetical protein
VTAPAPHQVRDAAAFTDAAAAVEHANGILPLLDLFPADVDGLLTSVRHRRLAAGLALFTPNALFDMTRPALRGVREGDRVVLDGRFRFADERTELSVVDVALDGVTRLALLPHETVDVAGTWGETVGVVLPVHGLSVPVSWAPGSRLMSTFDGYAWEFARCCTAWSATVVSDLRRVLAITGVGAEALSTSQYVAHELSKLEIEILLAGAASGFGPEFKAEPPGGQRAAAVLLSGTDLLARTVAVTENLAASLGLRQAPCRDTGWPGASVHAWFGGRRMVERELARRMGLVREVSP